MVTMAVDVVMVLVFAILARLAHQSADEPFTVANVLDTWWPFVLGAIAGGAVMMASARPLIRVAPGGVIVWICTVASGLGIWALRHGSVPHWSFIIVATVMSGLLLLGWRAIAIALNKR
ncbi:DUF3054 domain-containing protein [Corynebacterium sp. TAE3-ERU12]|uniref:DUF3054 domain-containing protein n=1 Tax=Corynebacterium sp. TAE3-ERU12 TaxID=2849491 RepID=UPI001C4571D0|nr:DUF3054 domain-containing protein [Corynebacterium sp. TAE3-ERU12]MBV7296060.1 DUF3054 domain-containing protein [Corynebacterium sp. TAE3-ERU12]